MHLCQPGLAHIRSLACHSTTDDCRTLYEKLGGAPAVEAAVAHFYKKVMADPLLVPFFEGVDMKKQAKKQVGR
jgi:truncated hemoglobin YjbI